MGLLWGVGVFGCGFRLGGGGCGGGLRGGVWRVYAAAVVWSTIGVASRAGFSGGCSPVGLLLLRHVVALVVAVVGVVAGWYSVRGLLDRRVVGVALAVMAPFYVSYAYAAYVLGVARAAAFLYTAPLWVYLVERLRGFRAGFGELVSAVLVGFGAVVLGYGVAGEGFGVWGLFWGFASGFTYGLSVAAAGWVLSRGVRPLDLAAGVQSWLLVGVVLYGLFAPVRVGLGCLPWAVYLGVVVSHLSYVLFYSGLSRVSPVAASSAASLELVLSVVWGWLLFGEPLSGWLLVGVGLVSAGLLAPVLLAGRDGG